MIDVAKKVLSDVSEVAKERLFSPMYFYFIIAWMITNWSFVYTLFFTNENVIMNSRQMLKIDYLKSFYNFSSPVDFYLSLIELLVIPAISAFVAAWWLSKLSEIFYKKYEEHKQENRIILKAIEYGERVKVASQERKIRDAESDKNLIKYEDNEEFNRTLDEEPLSVAGLTMLPSEVLYNNDYEAYREALSEWLSKDTSTSLNNNTLIKFKTKY